MRRGVGQLESRALEEVLEVGRPADGHEARAHHVLQHEVPTDHPREDLADGGVAVRVGAARHGDHGGEFGVAEGGARARQGRDDEGEHDAGARMGGRLHAREHEDAHPDDAADADGRQVPRPRASLRSLRPSTCVSTIDPVMGLVTEATSIHYSFFHYTMAHGSVGTTGLLRLMIRTTSKIS